MSCPVPVIGRLRRSSSWGGVGLGGSVQRSFGRGEELTEHPSRGTVPRARVFGHDQPRGPIPLDKPLAVCDTTATDANARSAASAARTRANVGTRHRRRSILVV